MAKELRREDISVEAVIGKASLIMIISFILLNLEMLLQGAFGVVAKGFLKLSDTEVVPCAIKMVKVLISNQLSV